MTIIKNEVRTITTVALTTKDIVKVFDEYRNKESVRIFYKRAFENIDFNDTTMGNLRNVLTNLDRLGNGDTYNLIAKVHGFDGWENAGYYADNKNAYVMVLYTYGDTMN